MSKRIYSSPLKRPNVNLFKLWSLLCFCLIFPSHQALANESWVPVKDQDGIKVFTRDVDGSAIKEFKGVVRIKTSLDSLAGVLHDTQACPLWVHQCIKPAIIKVLGFEERYIYQVNDFPFPASNRDIVMHAQTFQTPSLKIITVKLTAKPDYCNNLESEVCRKIRNAENVRIQESIGSYQLRTLNDGWIEVTWQQHIEPGGALPNWMINSMLTEVPFNTLSKLRQLVKEEKYQQARLEYDQQGIAIGFKIKNW